MNWFRGKFEAVGLFFQEVRGEMLKVTWLSREELWVSLMLVIVATLALSTFIAVEDKIFEWIIGDQIMDLKK